MLVGLLEQVYQQTSSRAVHCGFAVRSSRLQLSAGLEPCLEKDPAVSDLCSKDRVALFVPFKQATGYSGVASPSACVVYSTPRASVDAGQQRTPRYRLAGANLFCIITKSRQKSLSKSLRSRTKGLALEAVQSRTCQGDTLKVVLQDLEPAARSFVTPVAYVPCESCQRHLTGQKERGPSGAGGMSRPY